MYTLYKINTDELNNNFIAAIKAQFPHQLIEIAISDISQIEQDETAYLLGNPANKSRLLEAIANVEKNQLINVDLETLGLSALNLMLLMISINGQALIKNAINALSR